MFGENDQCGASLGFMAVWWCQIEREQGEVDGFVVAVFVSFFRLAFFGQMYMVAIPAGLA